MYSLDKDALKAEIQQTVRTVLENALNPVEIVEEESSAETTSTDDVGAKDMNVGKKKEDDESEDDEKESDDEVKEACKTKSK